MDDPTVNIDATTIDERKLWLEYLKSLNQRRLQSAQRSGLTSYALLATLAGLLYKFTPSVPKFLAAHDKLHASFVIFVLEADALIFFLSFLGSLLQYCTIEWERRAIPETKKRIGFIASGVVYSSILALASFQAWVGSRLDFPNRFVKWSVIIIAALLVAQVLVPGIQETQKIRRARKHKIPAPRFTSTPLVPGSSALAASILLIGLSILTVAALIVFMMKLAIDWVVPLTAASVSLSCLIICEVLFLRTLVRMGEGTYDTLERDILLDRLGVEEIRARFIRLTLGPDVATWLDELLNGLKSSHEALSVQFEASRRSIQEISAINSQYTIERSSRARSCPERIVHRRGKT